MATWPARPPCNWLLLGQPARAGQCGLIAALQAQPAFEAWVQALEIAGPGFINIRLFKPAAKAGGRQRCWAPA